MTHAEELLVQLLYKIDKHLDSINTKLESLIIHDSYNNDTYLNVCDFDGDNSENDSLLREIIHLLEENFYDD